MKIAVLQTAFLGDVVLTAPFIDALYKFYGKDLELYYILSKGKEALFKDDPRIKEVIVYDKRGKDKGFSGIWRLSRRLSKLKLDIFFNLHRYSRSHLLVLFTRAKLKYGFFDFVFWPIYKKTIKRRKDLHEVLRNAEFLKLINLQNYDISKGSKESQSSLYVNHGKKEILQYLFTPYIVIAPGTEGPTKAWPKEYYKKLLNIIIEKTDFKVLVLGSPKDIKRCQTVVNDDYDEELSSEFNNLSFLSMPKIAKNTLNSLKEAYSKHQVFNFCGKTTVRELVDIVAGSSLTITNDSGPLHIASLTNTRVMGFFGPTVESFGFFPYTNKALVLEDLSVKCRPCSMHGAKPCKIKTHDCLTNIKPDFAFNKVIEFLKTT